MANEKITELTALTAAATADVLAIVDDPSGSPVTKKITVGNLMRGVPDGTAAAPGLAFADDTDSGLYRIGADNIAIGCGGVAFIECTEAANDYLQLLNGLNFIGDLSGNANMTVGLTIQQGANDNEIAAWKSSDVDHAMTASAEADTFGSFRKSSATAGGLLIAGYRDSDDTAGKAVELSGRLGEVADTTHTTAGIGITHVSSYVTNAGTGIQAPAANSNLFAVASGSTTAFIVDTEGDLFANGGTSTTAVTVYDDHDDAELLRALTLARGGKGIIRSEFDKWLKYDEASLVEMGILGDTIENGGLINVTRLQQLLVGFAWQAETKIREMRTELDGYRAALLGLGADPKMLTKGA